MQKYTLYWLSGRKEVVKGDNIKSAVANAGYGGGAMGALDFYDDGDTRGKWIWHKWSSGHSTWVREGICPGH